MKSKNSAREVRQARQVLILDDHPMMRYGIRQLLAQESDLACCGEAATPAEALKLIKERKPDIILVDLTLPQGDGLEFIKDLRVTHSDLPVLVVSVRDETFHAERALRAGARGYLMKSEGGAKLVNAIRRVLRGKFCVSERISARVIGDYSESRRETGGLGKLTDREFEVLGLFGQGLSTREISRRLNLSVKTVETHRLHAKEKLQIKSTAGFIKYAVQWAAAQNMT